jgi:hypothetical protein
MKAQHQHEQNRTAHFRNLLREEMPSATDAELIQWKWQDGPLFKFQPLPHEQPGHPGQEAAEKMHHALKEEKAGRGPLACRLLPIQWRTTSHPLNQTTPIQ